MCFFSLEVPACVGDDCSINVHISVHLTVTVRSTDDDIFYGLLVFVPVLLVIGVIVVIICVKRRQRRNKLIDHRIEQ